MVLGIFEERDENLENQHPENQDISDTANAEIANDEEDDEFNETWNSLNSRRRCESAHKSIHMRKFKERFRKQDDEAQ